MAYFGTADSYLPYLTRFLRPGGHLAMATPTMTREVCELGAIPPHIKKVVGWEAIAWHTAEWWRFQWAITELVEVTSAWLPQDAWRDWLLWAPGSSRAHARRPEREPARHRHAHHRRRRIPLLRSDNCT
ncbi:hypothetical protein GCM10010277_87420 [Streptomyces longisporoflavus]|nr:hypothetical protein GCM10010277_87420 [Streptomyces longisporoflavus]